MPRDEVLEGEVIDRDVDIVAQTHPLCTRDAFRVTGEGARVSEIVAGLYEDGTLDSRWGVPTVQLVRGGERVVVPCSLWRSVRPRAGTRVEVSFPVEGPALGAVAAALVPAAAEWLAGTAVFAPLVSAVGSQVVIAGISIVAGLAINALIPPPEQPRLNSPERVESFAIGGVRNELLKYGRVPKTLGRHRSYPVRTAKGYTETAGDDLIFYRGRMALSVGKVALEDLRIGDTRIDNFDDVELEFIGVDETETLSLSPELAAISTFRPAGDWSRIYSQDVDEQSLNVKIDDGAGPSSAGFAFVRTTASNTLEASVDVTFPEGLGKLSNDGDVWRMVARVQYEFRASGSADPWTDAGEEEYIAGTINLRRFTKRLEFPSAGSWDIRVQVTYINDTPDSDVARFLRDAYWTSLRSFQNTAPATLDKVPEIAFRVRASEQLNGVVDRLNVIVHQMARVWTGSAYEVQRTRHPAWIYLDGLTGDHLAHPLPDEEIDTAALIAWAAEEPHWTCDYVVRGQRRVGEILDIVAACGRAKRGLVDFKHTVIRDNGAETVPRAVLTPRETSDFRAEIVFPKEVHAFRVRVRSEDADWQEIELLVYNDGYDETNATEFETLELPGTVIAAGDADEGNAWRLARYWLAAAELRRERFRFRVGWQNFRNTRGDLVRLVHDVPLVGKGFGRVTAVDQTAQTITLDADLGLSTSHRLTVREANGDIATLTATGSGKVWTVTAGDMSGVEEDNLATVEETTTESLNLLITSILPDENDDALVEGVLAAPAVLQADQGTIPSFSPVITAPENYETLGPEKPVVRDLISGRTATVTDPKSGIVYPRALVTLEPRVARGVSGEYLQIRWRRTIDSQGSALTGEWSAGPLGPVGQSWAHTERLAEGVTYAVEVRAVDGAGRSRGWVPAGAVLATIDATPADVTGFTKAASSRGVRLAWDRIQTPEQDIRGYAIKFSSNTADGWGDIADLSAFVDRGSSSLDVPAQAGVYLIKAQDHAGQESATAASVTVTAADIGLTSDDLEAGLLASIQTVRLSLDDQQFTYDSSGGAPSPSSTTASAAASAVSSPHFEFLVDGVSVQNSTSATYTYTPRASVDDMPDKIEVKVRDGSTTGTVLASDVVTAIGLQPAGSGGSAPAGSLSNETTDVPADSSGNVLSYAGTGTLVEVFIGIERQTFDGSGTTAGKYDVAVSVEAGTYSPDTTGSVSGSDALFGNGSGLTTESAVVRYTISGQDSNGVAYSITLDQTLTKRKAGADGMSVHTFNVFRRAASAPATPSGGSWSFTTNSGTAPSGWNVEPPAGSDPLYVSQATASVQGATGTDSSLSWSTPAKFVEDGDPGADGLSVHTLNVYRRNTTQPATPGGGAWDFSTNTGTPPTGWSFTMPAGSDPVWVSQATAAVVGQSGTDTTLSWSSPAKVVENGVDGSPGLSVAQITVYKRSSSAPPTPNGGSFDFDTKSVTPPSGWSAVPPSGDDPLYSSIATASVQGTTGTDSSLTWSSPDVFTTAGKSTYQASIYRRAASQPATPSGGTFDFGANDFTSLPSGWSKGVPADDGNPIWQARYLFAISGDTSSQTAGAWSTPEKIAEDGAQGPDGISTFMVTVYKRSASAPATPSGGSYDFGTQGISPPTGWSEDVPTGDDPLYSSQALASVQGTTGTDSSLTWGSPRKVAESGVSTTVVRVYKRSASAPATPSGGDWDFGANSGTAPTGWSLEPPTGTVTLWTSQATASVVGATATDSSLSWSSPVKLVEDGAKGDTGDSVYTGRVWFQTLQSGAPSTPSASSYDPATDTFSGLSSGWETTQPPIDATDTSVKEWSSAYTVEIDGVTSAQTITFSAPVGAIQINSLIASVDYDGSGDGTTLGTQGWAINLDGFAEFDAAVIRGKLTVGQIEIDTDRFGDDGSGAITIVSGGVVTDLLGDKAVTAEKLGELVLSSSGRSGVITGSTSEQIYWGSHGLSVGDRVVFADFNLPCGIEEGRPYYVKSVVNSNYITISETSGGSTLNITANAGGFGSRVTGVQINTPYFPDQIAVFQDSSTKYALEVENAQSGAAFFRSDNGYTVQIVQNAAASGNAALDAQNNDGAGGHLQVGLSTSDGGYAAYAVDGDYYVNTGGAYLPFTGRHELLVAKGLQVEPGDIVCDGALVARSLSDAITELEFPAHMSDQSVVGVYVGRKPFSYVPAALRDGKIEGARSIEDLIAGFDIAFVNAVGEGAVSVCGHGGDIQAGDLVVTSPIPGKGMRQGDNIVRAYTVAKAREAVSFASKSEVKTIACTYLCG